MRHDDILAEELDRIDHSWVHDRLNSLLVFIFEGSPFYEGDSIRSDFKSLLETDHHYNRFANHFQTTLHASRIAPTLRQEAQAVIELVRDYMLERQLA
ncbi:hypothetical protein [Breoghania sp.]|uniref:hypothetical protein n=1 Tax=Breoghania sp. TaxID=2065378 RepID=UPI002632019A|nr:hypothetical protein [Breoghania sp.]MDJ0929907.1 hypothetical protein [Breoghania sp.]